MFNDWYKFPTRWYFVNDDKEWVERIEDYKQCIAEEMMRYHMELRETQENNHMDIANIHRNHQQRLHDLYKEYHVQNHLCTTQQGN